MAPVQLNVEAGHVVVFQAFPLVGPGVSVARAPAKSSGGMVDTYGTISLTKLRSLMIYWKTKLAYALLGNGLIW